MGIILPEFSFYFLVCTNTIIGIVTIYAAAASDLYEEFYLETKYRWKTYKWNGFRIYKTLAFPVTRQGQTPSMQK